MLNLVAKTFTIRRLAVAMTAMLFLVDIPSSTTLKSLDLRSHGLRIDALTPV
jgi:hypothetical protein